jgi:hypothetical protein
LLGVLKTVGKWVEEAVGKMVEEVVGKMGEEVVGKMGEEVVGKRVEGAGLVVKAVSSYPVAWEQLKEQTGVLQMKEQIYEQHGCRPCVL